MYDLIIIGSGPAGLAAAIYGIRAGMNLLVIEKAMMSGGQIINTYEVDNYPGLPGINGFDLAMKMREHADKLGASFVTDEVLDIDVSDSIKKVVCKKETYDTKTVILATGASHSLLGLPAEAKLSGAGVSYCATCDGAFFKGKTTVVVGGGDVALEDAIFLSRLCEKVYIVHRRDEFRGAKSLQKNLLEQSNVVPVMDSVVEDILGDTKVSGVKVKNVKTGKTEEIVCDGVFIAVGIVPETKAWHMVKKDDKGYIVTDENCATDVPGVYAVGDCRTKLLRQVITAAADGAIAVTAIDRYLHE